MLGSQRTQKLGLFFGSLESSVSKLGRSIDKLEVDRLQKLSGRVLDHRLSQDQRTLLDSNDTSLDHDPVLIDFTIMHETSHGRDTLFSQISLSLARSLVVLLSNTVDLLVEFGTVEVSILTGTGNGSGNTGRMPRSNTGDLTKTTMGLSWKTRDTPTSGNTLVTATLGNSDNINILVLVENRVDGDLLFEQTLGKRDLSGSISSIDLDFHDVSLLQTKVKLLDLGVGDNADSRAKLADAVEFSFNILATILVLGSILGVSLFLTLEPILVAPTLEFFIQMLGEDSGQSAETRGSLDVSNNTDNNHRRGLDNGNSIDDFTLVHEGTGTVDTTGDVGHTGLVSAERSEVGSLNGMVPGERTNTTSVTLGTLLGQETQTTMAGCFEFSVRPVIKKLVRGTR